MTSEASVKRMLSKCREYTMTNDIRLTNIWDVTKEISELGLKSCFIEAGVYKGGCSMMMAYSLMENGMNNDLYLFDTFEGMTEPCEKDKKIHLNVNAMKKWKLRKKDDHVDWCYASFEEVKDNLKKTKYKNVNFVKGDVLNTVPYKKIEKISLLRIDTDFYESTKHLLNEFFDLIETGGFLIVDDYGTWEGSRLAVNEFFKSRGLKAEYLIQVDHACYMYQIKGNK